MTTTTATPTRGTRKQHGIEVGDEFWFFGPIAPWAEPIRARLELAANCGYRVVKADGDGTLDAFGVAGTFWAARVEGR